MLPPSTDKFHTSMSRVEIVSELRQLQRVDQLDNRLRPQYDLFYSASERLLREHRSILAGVWSGLTNAAQDALTLPKTSPRPDGAITMQRHGYGSPRENERTLEEVRNDLAGMRAELEALESEQMAYMANTPESANMWPGGGQRPDPADARAKAVLLEARRIARRYEAALCIQGMFKLRAARTVFNHRKSERCLHFRVQGLLEACVRIQSVVRSFLARRVALQYREKKKAALRKRVQNDAVKIIQRMNRILLSRVRKNQV